MYNLEFRPSTSHNPNCNILEFHSLDNEYFLTFGRDLRTREEFIEYYSGPNYGTKSKTRRSYSRYYSIGKDKLPKWIADQEDLLRVHFNTALALNK